MKTLLVGGPEDGKIIDTRRNDFGVAFVTDVFNKNTGALQSRTEHYYSPSYEPGIKHPCKKRGTVRVWRYRPEGKPKA